MYFRNINNPYDNSKVTICTENGHKRHLVLKEIKCLHITVKNTTLSIIIYFKKQLFSYV